MLNAMDSRDKLLEVEGIVLRALPHKDFDRILTLYTPMGLIKLYVKLSKRKLDLIPLVTPYNRAEYTFTPSRSELHRFYEGSLLNQNLALRNRFESLQVAEMLSSTLLKTQWLGKPSPLIYTLFSNLLQAIPLSQTPESLYILFLAKLLKHEGIFHLKPECCHCGRRLKESYRIAGECFCKEHAPLGALLFTEEEEKFLYFLFETRSLIALNTLPPDVSFSEKIQTLFNEAFR